LTVILIILLKYCLFRTYNQARGLPAPKFWVRPLKMLHESSSRQWRNKVEREKMGELLKKGTHQTERKVPHQGVGMSPVKNAH